MPGLTIRGKGIVGLVVVFLLGVMAGCGRAPLEQAPDMVTAVPWAPPPATSDKVRLEEALKGRMLAPVEVADLSDRLLSDGNSSLNEEQTMARLEILLLKALKVEDKTSRPVLWRNLGIIHYHQRKYTRARQELQASNELNPRDARTHFYLARLFVHQGAIYEGQGKKSKSKQQFKRAAIEMEQARKLAPNNPLYRQDLRQILQPEPGR